MVLGVGGGEEAHVVVADAHAGEMPRVSEFVLHGDEVADLEVEEALLAGEEALAGLRCSRQHIASTW